MTWLSGLSQTGLLRIRLECCLADLAVRAGQSPEESYADLDRRALGGRIPERFAVLVHMRRGRALALADLGREAIEAYRRAVLAATQEGLGGDARHALRSISYLADQYNVGFRESSQAMLSARTVGAKGARLINLSFNPAVSALEALVDDRLPDASRAAHQWLWQDRISGALTDENLAHQRYGEVFNRAGETKHAVRQFVLAGRRKDALSATESVPEFLDVRDLLEVRTRWVCSAAAAVIGQQADPIPNDAVAGIAARLTDIVNTGLQSELAGLHPVMQALGALGALDERLPAASAQQVLPLLIECIPREPGTSRHIDEQMLAFLGACIKAELPVADRAIRALMDAWKLDVNGAESLLAGLHAHVPSAVPAVRERAQQGHRRATAVLAGWRVDDPSVTETARELADTVLAEPVGTVRPFYAMGTVARQCAAFLIACEGQSTVGAGEPIRLLRERVATHLLLWAQDRNDTADRRSEAVRALSILAETLPAPVRDDSSNGSWVCTQIRENGMRRRRYPSDTSIEEWALLEPLLPTPACQLSTGGHPEKWPRREIVDAIRYVVDTGCKRRALPADFPPFQTVFGFFSRWRAAGIFNIIRDQLRRRVRRAMGASPHPVAAVIDSQSVKVTATVPSSTSGFDPGKKITGRKRHIVCDMKGLLLFVMVTPADTHDAVTAKEILLRLRLMHPQIAVVWADSIYGGCWSTGPNPSSA